MANSIELPTVVGGSALLNKRTSSLRLGVTTAALLMAVTVLPANAANNPCANPETADAFAVRDLQSQLLVAGLACGQRKAYNAFIAHHAVKLGQAGSRLIVYFEKIVDGQRLLDTHVTRAANAAAQVHAQDQDTFCQSTANLYRQLVGASAASLVQTARTFQMRAVEKPEICAISTPASNSNTMKIKASFESN